MKQLSQTSLVIYSLIILLNFLPNTYAANSGEYPLPAIIAVTDLSTSDGVDAILASEKLTKKLKSFANNLTVDEIEQQSTFNKMALLSLRDDLSAISNTIKQQNNTLEFSHYQLYHQTGLAEEPSDFIKDKFEKLNDEAFVQMSLALGWSVSGAKSYVFNVYKRLQNKQKLSQSDMISIAVNSHLYQVLHGIIPITDKIIKQEQQRRFIIQPDVLVKLKNGIELSTTIVRSRSQLKPKSTALQYTIYADEASHIKTAMHAAAHGYIGIVANSRGKRSSSNKIVPWEHEGEDASQLINWITEQAWSNGTVVMYGGSYNGFTQWATAKYMPKGLKAMAPYVAANLITGLPYENNIALTGNFEWPLYVTNNKTVDNTIYNDWQRTEDIVNELYTSGRPISDIDKIANKPSPWLQKWLSHPEDSTFYQNMVPYREEYQRIDIPVLSITGYFEGGQISALTYLYEHFKYNDRANHALLIGPYNHMTAQGKPRSHHSNYELDLVALEKDTEEVVFEWFDHVLYGKPKPKLVQNNVNYQVMGANQWRYADSLQTLNQQTVSFYIQETNPNAEQNHILGIAPSIQANKYIEQTIDMTDRTEQRNLAPWLVIKNNIDKQGGIQLETPVFEQDMELTGAISGFFDIAINNRDVDIGFNYYEVTASGEVFHLNNYRSRVSYAEDMGKRRLLIPNQKRRVPIVNARFTSKLIKKGSKIVLVLNVNKNKDAQVNLGSGKPVNYEQLSDAGQAMKLKWYLSSQINLPLKLWRKAL
ncbi:CocE/NonD family hydrolase [Psychrosphaera sp. F3M07]|uniref:CocE/NonD family hydrolase n=1 Tax=Psychrosphaera sp. F3M07 TaxID=2841560 RepID=UPI001C08FA59|nr:CocE/NonD family hydrolase [Psychrosphaera sp. F3M07]MBU2917068.1 CocE/NonD family hydrolase [Psychrosphaera sp. F3M07]